MGLSHGGAVDDAAGKLLDVRHPMPAGLILVRLHMAGVAQSTVICEILHDSPRSSSVRFLHTLAHGIDEPQFKAVRPDVTDVAR